MDVIIQQFPTKLRVACAKTFPNTLPEDVEYFEFGTIPEAKEYMKKLSQEGKYQSSFGGHIPGLANVAVLEYWNEAEGDWLTWFDHENL